MSILTRKLEWLRIFFGGAGTAGQVLTSNGASLMPSWQAGGGGGGGPADQLDADGTTLDVNAIGDTNLLRRSGTTVIGMTCTAAGAALLDDADAAAQRTTLGISVFGSTLIDDANAAAARATLEIGSGQGTVDFGVRNDFASITIAAAWITTSHRIIPTVRGGTTAHPLADEDAAIEELHATVIAQAAGTVTIGVHAPNSTTGDYLVEIVGIP